MKSHLEEVEEEVEEALEVTASREAEEFAAELIEQGKTTTGGRWSGPSAALENSYLETNGLEKYAKWFLGRKTEFSPDTKAHYNFPFSDDFKTVHRRGLIAIRSRAAQNDDQSVYEAAGRLLALYPEDKIDQTSEGRTQRISFQRRLRKSRGRYKVDAKTGEMRDVSLIQIGEAKGHGMWIDERSLDSALEVLGEAKLPAYVTHNGALESDRLLNEIGVFSDFYVEEGKLKAERFKALGSFKEDEPERFRRLFDLAEAMPDAFGLSLVFEASLVWIMEDGEEIPIEDGAKEDALREVPSIRFTAIRSADFVDAPAANEEGLFSIRTKTTTFEGKNHMAEEETREEETLLDEETSEEAIEEIEEENSLDSLMAKIEELAAKIEAQQEQITELTSNLSEAEDKNEKLSAMIAGEQALEEGDQSEQGPSLVERFNSAKGAEQTRLWKQNKQELLRATRRG